MVRDRVRRSALLLMALCRCNGGSGGATVNPGSMGDQASNLSELSLSTADWSIFQSSLIN